MLTWLIFLSGFFLSATSAYYSVIGLMAIFPGAEIAIIAMGASLELAKLVAASWLYRNWKVAPLLIKTYMTAAVVILMLITSMGIFGFLSKSHIEHSVGLNTGTEFQIESLNTSIESKKNSISLIERQLNNIDNSLSEYIKMGQISRGLRQKAALDAERKELETRRTQLETEIVELSTKRNELSAEVQIKEVEVGPLKYIAELIYGESAESHFDSAVRWVIGLLIIVFDPLAVVMLIAGNVSLMQQKTLEIKPKRKYTKRRPYIKNKTSDAPSTEEDFGINYVVTDENSNSEYANVNWSPSVLRRTDESNR